MFIWIYIYNLSTALLADGNYVFTSAVFANEIFSHSVFVPTIEGQYIIKNLVLISAGIVIGSTVKGAGIIAGPDASQLAKK